MSRSLVRCHYIFTGQVQGVGFRWSARMLADSLGLTGWVENMWDGSVEMELQGPQELLIRMIDALQNERYIRIDNIEKKNLQIEEDERNFEVRH